MPEASNQIDFGSGYRLAEALKTLEKIYALFLEEGIRLSEPLTEEDTLGAFVSLLVPGPSALQFGTVYIANGFTLTCGLRVYSGSSSVHIGLAPQTGKLIDLDKEGVQLAQDGERWLRTVSAKGPRKTGHWLDGLGIAGLEGKLSVAVDNAQMLETVKFMAGKLRPAPKK